MTWRELKEFCNKLHENELNKDVVLWCENETIHNMDAYLLGDNYYMDPRNPEKGCFPEFIIKADVDNDEELLISEIKRLKKMHDKGDPMLGGEFAIKYYERLDRK
jgi:hypothetical protein